MLIGYFKTQLLGLFVHEVDIQYETANFLVYTCPSNFEKKAA